MERFALLLVVSATFAALIVAGALRAADEKKEGPNKAEKVAGQADTTAGVELVELSSKLAEWGRDNKNPAALAVASSIMRSARTQPLKDVTPKEEKGKGAESATSADDKKKEIKAETADSLRGCVKSL